MRLEKVVLARGMTPGMVYWQKWYLRHALKDRKEGMGRYGIR